MLVDFLQYYVQPHVQNMNYFSYILLLLIVYVFIAICKLYNFIAYSWHFTTFKICEQNVCHVFTLLTIHLNNFKKISEMEKKGKTFVFHD